MAGQIGGGLLLDQEGRWLVAHVERSWGKNDVYFEDLREAKPTWRTLVEGRDASFWPQVYRGTIYLRSTDGASRGELVAIDPLSPERRTWKRIVPEHHDAKLVGFQIAGGRLVLRYQEDGVLRMEVKELDGTPVRASPPRIGELSG